MIMCHLLADTTEELLGDEHDSCKIPDSRYKRAETRRAV
jgi:hypothetical protein